MAAGQICPSARRAARREVARGGAVAVVVERPAHRGEGEVVPGDLLPGEELDLEALGPGREFRRRQMGAIDELHLADARNVVDGEQAVDSDARLRLFPGLADGPGRRRFIELEVSGRQGPVATPRID